MRCDHMKRHMKIHVNLSLEEPKQICKSILGDNINDIPSEKTSKDETSIYREKRKDAHSDVIDEPPLSADEIDDEELEK